MTLLYLVPSLSCLTYRVKARGLKRYVSHHLPITPVTQQLGLFLLYCFSVLSALLLQLPARVIFHYSELLVYLCHDYSKVIIISNTNHKIRQTVVLDKLIRVELI